VVVAAVAATAAVVVRTQESAVPGPVVGKIAVMERVRTVAKVVVMTTVAAAAVAVRPEEVEEEMIIPVMAAPRADS